jgi:hypothetical protein
MGLVLLWDPVRSRRTPGKQKIVVV